MGLVPISTENRRPEASNRLSDFFVLQALHHILQLPGSLTPQWRRCSGALNRLIDRLLDDAELVDGGEAEEAVDALNELALRMGQKKGACAFAGDGQHAGAKAAVIATARPGDFFGPGAIGEILAGDFVPGTEERAVDAGTAGENGIDDAVRQLGNLLPIFAWITH